MVAKLKILHKTLSFKPLKQLTHLVGFGVFLSLLVFPVICFQGANAGQLKEQRAEGILALLALSLFAKTAANSANVEREREDQHRLRFNC